MCLVGSISPELGSSQEFRSTWLGNVFRARQKGWCSHQRLLLNMAWLHALQSAPPPRIRQDFLGSAVTPGSHAGRLQARMKPGSLTAVNHSCFASLALLWRTQRPASPKDIFHRTMHFGGHCFPRHRNSGVLLVRRCFCSALASQVLAFKLRQH